MSLNSSFARFVFLEFSKIQVVKFDFLVGSIRTVIRFDRFDIFSMFLKDGGSQGSQDFSDKL